MSRHAILDHSEPALKIVCLVLGLLMLFQAARLVGRQNPLSQLKMPVLASVSIGTKAPPGVKETNAAPGPNPAMNAMDLPPAVKALVERINQSEIFGPIPRPMPMALLGIAGKDALVRAPNGQTGLLNEGGELGGIKLLRIGTNRVLVEHEGQPKELTIFAGFGSETLLPKGKENPQ